MLKFAIKNMAVKKGKLILVTLSILLSATVALLAYNVSSQVSEGIVNTAAYYDIIIGPSGSATQLAMNTMFFTDSPLGTIPYSYVTELEENPNVNSVVPFTMGDSYNAAKIVGTTPEFLDGKPLSEGVMFADTYEAVVGAEVARMYDMKVGDEIVTSHGLDATGEKHTASPLKIVGILKTTHTAYDNAVFTSYKTVWAVHGIGEEHEEAEGEEDGHATEGTVCAILVKTKDFNSYYAISQYYGQDSSLLVINPSTVLREVLENVDLSTQIVYLLSAIILVMNIFVVVVITLLNLYDARREIALMRLIGIGMRRITQLYTIQNALIGLLSTILALGASMIALNFMGGFVASMGIVLNWSRVYVLEWAILGIVFVISVLPTVVLAGWMARKDGVID